MKCNREINVEFGNQIIDEYLGSKIEELQKTKQDNLSDSQLHNIEDVFNKADKSEIPTKTSQLQNDSNFLTSHQDISGKQDKLIAGNGISIAEDGRTISSINVGDVTKKYVDDELLKKQNKLSTQQLDNINDVPNKTTMVDVEKKGYQNYNQVESIINSKNYITSQYVDKKLETKLDKNLLSTINGQKIDTGLDVKIQSGVDVIPSENSVEGATSLKNLNIDGKDWAVKGELTPEQESEIAKIPGKLDTNKLATVNNQRLDQGGNIVVAGGSDNINPNTVTPEMTTFIKPGTQNLWNGQKISGKYIVTSGFTAAGGYDITKPVFYKQGYKITVTAGKALYGNVAHYALTTESGDFLDWFDGNLNKIKNGLIITIPKDGYYSFNMGQYSKTFIIYEGEFQDINDIKDSTINLDNKSIEINKMEYNPLLGKKIACAGDSICYGVGYTGGYAKIIAEENNMTYQNIGVGGATIKQVPEHDWIGGMVENIDTSADYIIFEGGVNDPGNNVPLGVITTEMVGALDVETFCGAMEKLFMVFHGNIIIM